MKRALITGASRGIGLGVTQKLIAEGWEVIGTSTTGNSTYQYPHLTLHQLDLKRSESIGKFVQNIKDLSFDLLVNNAGIAIDFFDDKISMDKLRETMDVNLFGPIELTELLLQLELLNRGSKILNISSQSGSITKLQGEMSPGYKISKVGLNMYSRTLAFRLKASDIDVYAVDPGWVETDMGGSQAPKSVDEAAEDIYKLVASDLPTGGFYLEGKPRDW